MGLVSNKQIKIAPGSRVLNNNNKDSSELMGFCQCDTVLILGVLR